MIGKFIEWLNENHVLDEANFAVNPSKTDVYDHKSTTYFEVTYLEKIKQTLLSGQPVFIDVPKNVTKDKVNEDSYNFLNIDDFFPNKLEKATTYQEFCNAAKPNKLRVRGLTTDNFVNHIWKGSFSNRGNSSSKGGLFETLFCNAFDDAIQGKPVDKKFESAIKKVASIIGIKSLNGWHIKNIGNNRSKRLNNLYKNLEELTDVTKLDFDVEEHEIGRTVADLILSSPNHKNDFYLSLKHGNTNEIVNFGAAKIRQAFQEYYDQYIKNLKTKKKTEPSRFLKNYCAVFGLDLKKMLMSFDFVSNNKNPKLEITQKYMEKNKSAKADTGVISTQLAKLIAYCIGYGYIYVHDTGKEIEVIDLRTNEDLAKIIKKYSGNYEVKYACDTGAKTVFDLNLCSEKDKKDIFIPQSRFELRPNQGGNINLFSLKLNINGEEI